MKQEIRTQPEYSAEVHGAVASTKAVRYLGSLLSEREAYQRLQIEMRDLDPVLKEAVDPNETLEAVYRERVRGLDEQIKKFETLYATELGLAQVEQPAEERRE